MTDHPCEDPTGAYVKEAKRRLERNKTHLLPVSRIGGARQHSTISLCGLFIGEVTSKFINVPDQKKRRKEIEVSARADASTPYCKVCARRMVVR